MIIKAPERITYTDGHSFCPGCGHGIAIRLIGEVLAELEMEEAAVAVLDVACGGMPIDIWRYDSIEAAHGRPIATAIGVKKVRPQAMVFAYLGDGAAYSIGIAETIHAAYRNDNIVVVTVNNCVYGMTGGQMSPTTLQGQITSSSRQGKNPACGGSTMDAMTLLQHIDVAYLARGALCGAGNIKRAKSYLTKAFTKQRQHEGYCLVELLSPCPTNWGKRPLAANNHLQEVVMAAFPVGEFVEREVR